MISNSASLDLRLRGKAPTDRAIRRLYDHENSTLEAVLPILRLERQYASFDFPVAAIVAA